ncbi:polymer-forming cytoskeletal protein [Haloferax sp. MBLA0076]|uniref:Polymer-forming cytoskeletal protein n=1 Tax=Haloferax litoreum TaxID=2666140 RepID=A0A6A8GKE6_9EURY|nr:MULTISPECIES: polymer-forming cytoskeletal protein [Haloferax]KAB1194360.1 polymer-forming cytoskeletal protein [Haloferax sp. CBA1148]MRX22922.1 polymer-forming cytoskeletal protein [Haloferax litoreum]
MANPIELIPLLVVVLLLVGVQGGTVESMEIITDGTHSVGEIPDVYVVGGGTVTIPANTTVSGDVYVIGGTADVQGTIDGDVTQLSGNLTFASSAVVAGDVQYIAGALDIADGATLESFTTAETLAAQSSSPASSLAFKVAQTLGLALAAALLVRRFEFAFATVGRAVTAHPVVSGVVGLLVATTTLALVVFMAMTIILIPVSVLGVGVGGLTVAYGYLVYGYLVGRRVPVDRPDVSTAVGVVLFAVVLELLGTLPLVGSAVQLGLLVVSLGAILVTYFGLREFEPVSLLT